MKKILSILIILTFALTFSACGKKTEETPDQANNVKLLINELELNKRPFVAMVPHSSGRLLSLYIDNVPSDAKSSTLDIEYLAGNLLKGGRVTLNLPVNTPFIQAFLLGSCSAGGKCSFDKDLTSGTLKHRVEFEGETHILKSNYVFINGEEVSTTDTKANFVPANKKQTNLILIDSQGLPAKVDGETVSSPFIITSITDDPIKGTLSLRGKDATRALIYDGSSFKEIPIKSNQDGVVVLTIDTTPWKKTAQIIRDDEQGKTEDVTVDILGPIILTK
jgi:hypothetical protein